MSKSTVTMGYQSRSSSEPFLLLPENRFAYASIERLKNRAGGGDRPLVYIYGPSGIGKSHLVRQFVRETGRKRPQSRMVHVTASELAAQLAVASNDRVIDTFQEMYRQLDVLICEDLHALENRYETQRQLTSFVDQIIHSGGRVLLTCKKPPGDLSNTLPRLINRCHGGLCVAVKPLCFSSRVSLLRHFAVTRQLPLPPDVIEVLAKSLPVSPRELLATVVQLETTAKLDGEAFIDVRFARRYLRGETKPRASTIPQIARAVARYFNVSMRDLCSAARGKGLVLPRQCAMYLCRELTQEPLAAIARFFGRSNHSTVVYTCQRIRTLLPEEPTLGRHLTQIQRSLARSGTQRD